MMHLLLLSSILLMASFTLAIDQPCTAYDTNGSSKFYDLNPLAATKDYYLKSFGGHEFYINICRSVQTDTWSLEDPSQVGGFMREDLHDFSIGQVNTTLQIRDGHPLLLLTGGSKCPGGGDLRASTAIRFICDRSVFSAGIPQLIAELPPQDEAACAFFIEWRTHAACPVAEPGSPLGAVVVVVMIVIGAFLLYIIFSVVYNRFALNRRGFSQLPRSPFSSSTSGSFFYDLCDRMSFRKDRWASDHSWPGFSRGDNFERLPTSHEEAQSMLNSSDERRHSDEEDEDERVTSPPAGMNVDAHEVIRS